MSRTFKVDPDKTIMDPWVIAEIAKREQERRQREDREARVLYAYASYVDDVLLRRR